MVDRNSCGSRSYPQTFLLAQWRTFHFTFIWKLDNWVSYKLHWSNGILLHSGLNPAWHFWLSTRFPCCLKMKSVENIYGIFNDNFADSREAVSLKKIFDIIQENTLKMFKTYFILRQQKIKFKPKFQAWSC